MSDNSLTNLEDDKLIGTLQSVNDTSSYFEDTLLQIVTAHSDVLDDLMKNIYLDVIQVDYPSIDTLEKYFLELTNTLYFMGEKLELLGIRDTVSKSQYKEAYNKAYLANQIKDSDRKNKTTVAENQAVAETAALYESAVNDIYKKAYQLVSYKIDAGSEMIKTLSKIITKRLNEMQLSERNYNIPTGEGTHGRN